MNDIVNLTPNGFDALLTYSDEKLLLEYRATNNWDYFSELIQRYEKQLLRYLFRFLGNRETAEDIFQQTFLLVFVKINQFREGNRVRPWIFRIATNQAIDFQRKKRRQPVLSLEMSQTNDSEIDNIPIRKILVGSSPDPLETVIKNENRDIIREAVNQLPEKLKITLQLIYFQGMKYREAAIHLGIPFGTVKTNLYFALKKLNHYLTKSGQEDFRLKQVS